MQEKKFVVVSGFTRNGIYDVCVKKLEKSLELLHVPHKLYEIPETGSWEKNCQYKATIILEALKEFKIPVVWVDADAELFRAPDLFSDIVDDYDIAYYTMVYPHPHLASGTLFFNNTTKAKDVLYKWISACMYTTEWDQRVLERVVGGSSARIFSLPVEYCTIFDSQRQIKEMTGEPVIVHRQRSREAKSFKRLNEVFDKIYVISTSSEAGLKKWAEVSGHLKSCGLRFERWEGSVPSHLKVPDRGIVGCKLSHINIIVHAKKMGYKSVLILEDDVVFEHTDNLEDTLRFLKKEDWAMFYLGGNHSGIIQKVSGGVVKISHTLTTHAYAVNKKYYERILDFLLVANEITDTYRYIDGLYTGVQKLYPCYCSYPRFVIQQAGYSEIRDSVGDNTRFFRDKT